MQIFLVLDNDRAHEASGFIDVALDRDARNHVAKLNLAALVGQNRDIIWIPLHEGLAFFHLGTIWLGNNGADDNVVAFQLAAFGIVHADSTVLV